VLISVSSRTHDDRNLATTLITVIRHSYHGDQYGMIGAHERRR
jgi:hypothetical protein